jgi:acyl-coenzyme A thioesterase 9
VELWDAKGLRRPVNVNPLIVETPEEKRLYALGERNSKIRKERRDTSLLKHTPNDLESDLIHAFWQKQVQYHGRLPRRTTFSFTNLSRSL